MHLKLGYMLKMFPEDFFLQQEPYITTDLFLWPQQVKFRNVLSSVVLPIRFQHGTSNIFLISKSWNWSWRRRYCQHALWSLYIDSTIYVPKYFCCINQEQKRKQRSMGVMVLVLGWLLAVWVREKRRKESAQVWGREQLLRAKGDRGTTITWCG